MLDICYLMSAYDPHFFKRNYKIKYVRHKDSREQYKEITQNYIKEKPLFAYQEDQANAVFKNTDYIISFVGLDGTKALFWSVFKVGQVMPTVNNRFFYELEEVKTFQDLKFRAVVEWGKATLRWHQYLNEHNKKQLIEVYPPGYIGNFSGYDNIILSFARLERLVQNQDANKDWYYALSSISAVYLICDNSNGKQYIGSAYGNKGGLWKRWTDYVYTKHGGNKQLRAICEQNENQHLNFIFSILLILPKGMSSKDVRRYEDLYKEKLGSRAYGLNSN